MIALYNRTNMMRDVILSLLLVFVFVTVMILLVAAIVGASVLILGSYGDTVFINCLIALVVIIAVGLVAIW